MFSCKHTACRKNIFSSRSAYRSCKAQVIQAGLKVIYDHIRRRLIREIRNLMEADQVHTALQALEHAEERICVGLCVIEAGKHRVLETYSALPCEIILLDKVDDILN